MNNRAKGIDGETVAVEYLKNNKYRILKRNYTEKSGEIDIIAMDGCTTVFVEVKNRTGSKFGEPIESVTPEKISKIIKTAEIYLLRKKAYYADCRFDVIVVKNGEIEEHIKNAFTRNDQGRKRHW